MPQSESRADAVPPSAEEQLRRLTGSLAHNLNNRLTVVIGSLELLAQELADSPLLGAVQAGLTSSLQAADVVRRMVAFAFRPSHLPDSLEVALGEVAENAARRLREQQRPGLNVEVIHNTVTPARANPLLVQMALEPLITNAVEAMPTGGTLSLEVRDEEAGGVSLEVRDTGPGLSDRAAQHLFEPFVTTRSAGHLGLGLVLSRDLAQALGGQLQLTWSASGTRATLTFAAERAGKASPPATGDEPPTSPPGTLWHVI